MNRTLRHLAGALTASLTLATFGLAVCAAQAPPVSAACTVPPTPTNEELVANANTSITESWSASPGATSYDIYRSTTAGGEGSTPYTTTTGTSFTDSGLSTTPVYFYEVSAVNAIGEGNKSAEASATPTPGTCPPAQLLGNPGFETGTAAPWSASSGVISDNTQEPPHAGSWDAWLDGYGHTHTDTLSQTVTLPAGCSTYSLSFWLHIDTAETTTTTAYDTLKVQVLNSSGTVLSTLHTYSNLNHNTGYAKRSFSLSSYAGKKITLKFTGAEDYELQTSFVVDDTAINVG